MKQYIRKADIILFIILAAVGTAASIVLAMSGNEAGSKVIIESGGDLYATYSMAEDRTIVIPAPGSGKTGRKSANTGASGGAADNTTANTDASGGAVDNTTANTDASGGVKYDQYNIVEIRDGRVSVTDSSCKNQVCVKHEPISKAGESIICLPNRLVVRIAAEDSEEGGGYDTITS